MGTNAEWRCIENNGSILPDYDWPFAEILGNNDNNSEWGMRPEILPNASWIWAQKLSSGDNPSKVACVPPPRVARCVDNDCEREFDKQGVAIRISADSDFKLFADETNETIGMGDDHEEEYEFFTELEHGSKLRVEAVDKHAESGLNPRSHRGIILSTSQGLVTNPEWRCIENNGSLLPVVCDWPFAEILGNNSASFEWGVRPEILPNASWIWAQKLSSGDYPSKVVCVPAPIPANEAAIPDQPVVISISADDEFELFADETNELIGKGNHYKEVYKFKFKTEFKHGSKLRVEAMELHPGSPRGIILSTSQGLVTNAEWRCIENNGSLVPDISDWPFAEMLGNNSANSQWDMRPEILPNASRIWAQKLSSGDYPSKVACVPAPSSAKCVDNGCEREFDGQGMCVDFSTSSDVNFTSLANQFDLEAGSRSGLCGVQQEECCHCLKKKPEPTTVTPEPTEVTQEPTEVTPEPTEVTPETTEVTPKPTELTQKPTKETQEPTTVTPEPTEVTPEPTEVTSETSKITLEPTKITPEPTEVTPDTTEVTPERTELTQKPTKETPEPTEVTPEPTEVTPEPTEVT